ncbi:MAG: hypothetical protein M1361_01025 [Patescibacteria group bacterium]|nr:hypothetical protein [Patescibacteria group bacterium]MCL5224186.1 hypothetical protein [Patescibacteria group bacterium]
MNNKSGWYAKLIMVIVMIVLAVAGFYIGEHYGQSQKTNSKATSLNNYYSDVAEWQTDTSGGTFSIAYPLDFQVDDNYLATPSTDWRINSNGTQGIKYLTLTIPRVFEPQTNFDDATLTVGASNDGTAVAQCMVPDPTNPTAATSSSIIVNGIEFTVFHSSDAGAGNYYQTTSYRAVHNNQCFAIEYTLHSSQIMNYPASYNLKPFDEIQATSVLDNIVGTFRFLR